MIKNKFEFNCTYCNSLNNISIKNMPKIGNETTITCWECGTNLTITLKKENYCCVGCKNEYETIKEKHEHQEKCVILEKRSYNCKYCKYRLTLDEDEAEELENKGVFEIECPQCKKKYTLKKHTS